MTSNSLFGRVKQRTQAGRFLVPSKARHASAMARDTFGSSTGRPLMLKNCDSRATDPSRAVRDGALETNPSTFHLVVVLSWVLLVPSASAKSIEIRVMPERKRLPRMEETV